MRPHACQSSCMSELAIQLGTIFVARMIVGNFIEVGVPYLRDRHRALKNSQMTTENDDEEYENPHLAKEGQMKKRQKSPCEEQFDLAHYDVLYGTFDDYAELVIQVRAWAWFRIVAVCELTTGSVKLQLPSWSFKPRGEAPRD